MERLNRKNQNINKVLTERVIQFGEGNFLRAFVDWQIDKMNKEIGFDAGIVVVQPRAEGMLDALIEQDCLYTLYTQGILDGKLIKEHEVITAITRGINPYADFETFLALGEQPDMKFIVSNTTEAVIYFDTTEKFEDGCVESFAGKLTSLMYHRYKHFNGAKDKGFILLPCELIERNGEILKETILKYAEIWNLEAGFTTWVEEDNIFCCTLVDRIVPGYPHDSIAEMTAELGYEDKMIVVGEPFNMFAIEAPDCVGDAFPAHKVGANTFIVPDLAPYRTRKVRILNGLHTAIMPIAYLMGKDTVGDTVATTALNTYLRKVTEEEIIPTIDLSHRELSDFSDAVMERFANPFITHYLMSISLNSIAKFKTRDLPTILDNLAAGRTPNKLLFSLAALIVFYRGKRGKEDIAIADDADVKAFFEVTWQKYADSTESLEQIVTAVLKNEAFWGQDLTAITPIEKQVQTYTAKILQKGMEEALLEVLF